MPLLTRLIPSPVVVDIRPGALDDLAGVLADERISHSGKLAVAVSNGSGAKLKERIAPALPGATWYEVGGGTLDDAIRLAGEMKAATTTRSSDSAAARSSTAPSSPRRASACPWSPYRPISRTTACARPSRPSTTTRAAARTACPTR